MSDLQSAPQPADTGKPASASGNETAGPSAVGGVKIYERPARTGPSPLMILIAAIIVIILAILLYMVFRH